MAARRAHLPVVDLAVLLSRSVLGIFASLSGFCFFVANLPFSAAVSLILQVYLEELIKFATLKSNFCRTSLVPSHNVRRMVYQICKNLKFKNKPKPKKRALVKFAAGLFFLRFDLDL